MRRNEDSGRTVVGRQRYKGTAVKWLDCIHIECSKDWEETRTTPDAVRITTSPRALAPSGTQLALAAADYDVEIHDGEGCIKNEHVLGVNIKAR